MRFRSSVRRRAISRATRGGRDHDATTYVCGDAAGVLSNNKIEATSVDEWRRVLEANLYGAMYWSQQVVPGMKERRWGCIINTSSLAAKTGGLTSGPRC
ncbi:MAG: SDR family NAD(P)-dependent oxidoreductase [Rubrivivax sp.]